MTGIGPAPVQVVYAFNRTNLSGTPVRYWPSLREGEGLRSRTWGAAWLLGGHTPVVRIVGEAELVTLDHVQPYLPNGRELLLGLPTMHDLCDGPCASFYGTLLYRYDLGPGQAPRWLCSGCWLTRYVSDHPRREEQPGADHHR